MFVWNAHRIEIGQNGQNGHSLESEGDFVFTQMSCFFTHFVSVMECLCICATSQNPFRIIPLWSLIKVKVRVECPPLWNRTKRTKRTLTGLKNRVRANPSELFCPPHWSRTKRTKRTLTGLGFNRVNTNLKSSDSQRALCRPWNADVYGPLRLTHFAFHCLESGSCGMPTALRSDKTDKPGKPDNHS